MPAALHKRQFVVGPHSVREDVWRHKTLDGGLVLSHCPDLHVDQTTDGLRTWTLIGTAINTDDPGSNALDAITDSMGELDTVVRTWAGRFVLVGQGLIYPDATAMLGCLYREIGEGRDAGSWVSSSAALLAELEGEPDAGSPHDDLVRGVGMEWYPGPSTRFPRIRRVLPSQLLDVTDGLEVRRRPLFHPRMKGRGPDEVLADIAARLTRTLQGVAAAGDGPPWLALTGGADSRLMLAAAMSAGIDCRLYTQVTPAFSSPGGDSWLPQRLAQIAGYEHHVIGPRKKDPTLIELWNRHTAHHSEEIDREFVARGQWDFVTEDTVVVRSGGFEIAKCPYHDGLPPNSGSWQERYAILETWSKDRGRRFFQSQSDALREYLEWMQGDGNDPLDWRDRLYSEQRVSGWLSSVEQGLDCTGLLSVQIANCKALLEDLLTIDADTRFLHKHQRELIGMMAPGLLDFPINPPESKRRTAMVLARREYLRYKRSSSLREYSRNFAHRLRGRITNPSRKPDRT